MTTNKGFFYFNSANDDDGERDTKSSLKKLRI